MEVWINSKEAYKLYIYKVSLKPENGILYLIIKAGLWWFIWDKFHANTQGIPISTCRKLKCSLYVENKERILFCVYMASLIYHSKLLAAEYIKIKISKPESDIIIILNQKLILYKNSEV